MRRLIQREIEDPLSILILERTDNSLSSIIVDYDEMLTVQFENTNYTVTTKISEEEVVHQTVK